MLDVGCGQVCSQPPASSLPPRIRHGGALNLLSASPGCSDFDPFSLRMELPGAVAALAQSAAANGGTSYVHCTGLAGWLAGQQPAHCFACSPGMAPHPPDALAPQDTAPSSPHASAVRPPRLPACFLRCVAAAGLGRAPATALGYMWWFKGWHLEDAYEHLTGKAASCYTALLC